MSHPVSTPMPLDNDNPTAEEPAIREEEAVEDACACPKCSLYKWYPPLLLLSTIMAGVFCWMYVTKPVFLSQPGEAHPVEPESGLSEPGSPPLSDDWEPPVAATGQGRLDPAISSLPGESGGLFQEPATVSVEEFKPIVIKREGPALFKPFVIEAEGDEGAKAGKEDGPSKETASTNVEEVAKTGQDVDNHGAEALAVVVSEESSQPADFEGDYGIGSSFMTEFLVGGVPSESEPGE